LPKQSLTNVFAVGSSANAFSAGVAAAFHYNQLIE